MNEAGIEAKQAKEKAIAARHIKKVQTVSHAYSENDGTVILMPPKSTCFRNLMHEQCMILGAGRKVWGKGVGERCGG